MGRLTKLGRYYWRQFCSFVCSLSLGYTRRIYISPCNNVFLSTLKKISALYLEKIEHISIVYTSRNVIMSLFVHEYNTYIDELCLRNLRSKNRTNKNSFTSLQSKYWLIVIAWNWLSLDYELWKFLFSDKAASAAFQALGQRRRRLVLAPVAPGTTLPSASAPQHRVLLIVRFALKAAPDRRIYTVTHIYTNSHEYI